MSVGSLLNEAGSIPLVGRPIQEWRQSSSGWTARLRAVCRVPPGGERADARRCVRVVGLARWETGGVEVPNLQTEDRRTVHRDAPTRATVRTTKRNDHQHTMTTGRCHTSKEHSRKVLGCRAVECTHPHRTFSSLTIIVDDAIFRKRAHNRERVYSIDIVPLPKGMC